MGKGRGGGGLGPTNNFGSFFTLLFGSMCSFRFDKASKLFIHGFNREKLLEINALQRLKMLFQRPYSSKSLAIAPTHPLQ